MKAIIKIMLKNGVLDPQGKAIEGALQGLGFEGVGEVRQGKIIELTLPDGESAAAKSTVEAMCQKLLANPVMENYTIEIMGEIISENSGETS